MIIFDGTVHKVPSDLKSALLSDKVSFAHWQTLTPLGRNEFICWTVTAKRPGTRANHIKRIVTELKQGKRRPCCWAGCPHREKNGR